MHTYVQTLTKHGLSYREVREPDTPSPPPSPPPLAELYPELRIAVYHITLEEEAEGEGAEQ